MAKIYHSDLYGLRKDKYQFLLNHDIQTVQWEEIQLQSPFYLFMPYDVQLKEEYQSYFSVVKIFDISTLGFQSHRDHFAIDFDFDNLKNRFKEFRNQNFSDDEIKQKYNLKDNRDWNVHQARKMIRNEDAWEKNIITCLYRPFDQRPSYFSKIAMDYPRGILQQNMLCGNLALNLVRQTKSKYWSHAIVSDKPTPAVYVEIKDGSTVFPLYIYPNCISSQGNLFTQKNVNFSSDFLNNIHQKIGYIPTPEVIFYYIYAIFYNPTYRQRYAEFLKIDFPRIPITGNAQLFQALAEKGEMLVDLHLMKSAKLNQLITQIKGEGNNTVTEVTYESEEQRIYINKNRYFEGIDPDVWQFKVGGYQVLDKWLKDRKKSNRTLSFDDVLHYQRIVVSLTETIQLMAKIDQLVSEFPII